MPWSGVLAAAALLAIGWLAIARVEELRGSSRYLQQQVAYSILAAGLAILVTLPSYRTVCRFSYAVYFAAVALLAMVFWFPAINGAHRWIRLGPVGVQPSELAKLAFILALARYLMYRDNYRRLSGLAAPLAITLLPMLLIFREPDLGTSLVFLPVFFIMLFAAGARRKDLLCVILAGLVVLPLLWTQMSREQKSRVAALFDQPGPGESLAADDYQLYRGKQVRALGGTWGSFFAGQPSDDPAAYRLPEAQSDFVFCMVGERFGLFGIAVVLSLYGLLVGQAFFIAAETREPFGRLLAAGIGGLFAVESLIHAGVTLGLLPVTGLSLPLVSHGGSGLLVHAAAIGLLVNIALRPGYEVVNEPFRYAVTE